MLRFVPDSWLEVLLRPFLMIDPEAGLYVEIHAPDWRFAALALLLVSVIVLQRRRGWLGTVQSRALGGLIACFYLWTWVSGNGRYFIWGLILVGPLVVVLVQRLPLTRAMRNFSLLGVFALQGFSVWLTFQPNLWALQDWVASPGLKIEETPLQREPAVYLTVGTISYSLLVPLLHPRSHWSNILGQQDIVPGMVEYARLQALLNGPLPKYVVVRATRPAEAAENASAPGAHGVFVQALARQGLALTEAPCRFVRADFAGLPFKIGQAPVDNGFWFCPARRLPGAPPEAEIDRSQDPVFQQVERRCPRFFPPGGADTRAMTDGLTRLYPGSDVMLTISHSGEVHYKYYRAFSPTVLGSASAVRRGDFQIDCDRLPGRYVPPWARD